MLYSRRGLIPTNPWTATTSPKQTAKARSVDPNDIGRKPKPRRRPPKNPSGGVKRKPRRKRPRVLRSPRPRMLKSSFNSYFTTTPPNRPLRKAGLKNERPLAEQTRLQQQGRKKDSEGQDGHPETTAPADVPQPAPEGVQVRQKPGRPPKVRKVAGNELVAEIAKVKRPQRPRCRKLLPRPE